MKILIACDKFKHSLSAIKVCQAIEKGLHKNRANLNIQIHPMADGGDGTLAVLKEHISIQSHNIETINPLGKSIHANYASFANTAFIELAEASGIALLEKEELNPLITTTIGTGLLVQNAISNGFDNIVISIGGSCTTDAGLGIAHALGFKFLDSSGTELIPSGGTLSQIQSIIKPQHDIAGQFKILCDVDNPLYGLNGAAFIFGPQKGASKEQVKMLDDGLQHIAKIIQSFTGKHIDTLKGGGAAGGIAAGLYGLLDAEIESGFMYLSHLSQLEEKIASADLIITGEGQLDSQSFSGKVVGQIGTLCRQYKKPLIAVVGNTTLTREEYMERGLQDVSTVFSFAKNINDAMSNAETHLIEISAKLELNHFS